MAALAGGSVAFIVDSANTETKREISHGIIAFGGEVPVAAVLGFAVGLLGKKLIG